MIDQSFRKIQPSKQPIRTIDWQDAITFKMENGCHVILVQVPGRQKMTFSFIWDTGVIDEGDKTGIGDLTCEMLGRGTQALTKTEFDKRVDHLGAVYHSGPYFAQIATLNRYKEQGLELLAQTILTPAFDELTFQNLKSQAFSSLVAAKDSLSEVAGRINLQLLFQLGHPYGSAETFESIERISAIDCKAFHQKIFIPNTAYLIVEGDISQSACSNLLEHYFKSWKPQGYDAFQLSYEESGPTQIGFSLKKSAVQSHIQIAHKSPYFIGTADGIDAQIMNFILGGYFSGRLNRVLREEKGFTYGITSKLVPDDVIGMWRTQANVQSESTVESIQLIQDQLQQMVQQEVDDAELMLAKSNLIGDFLRSFENPATIGRLAFNLHRYNLPADYYRTYLQKIEAVSRESVLIAAQKYLRPDNLSISVVGNELVHNDLNKHFSASIIKQFDANSLF